MPMMVIQRPALSSNRNAFVRQVRGTEAQRTVNPSHDAAFVLRPQDHVPTGLEPDLEQPDDGEAYTNPNLATADWRFGVRKILYDRPSLHPHNPHARFFVQSLA